MDVAIVVSQRMSVTTCLAADVALTLVLATRMNVTLVVIQRMSVNECLAADFAFGTRARDPNERIACG